MNAIRFWKDVRHGRNGARPIAWFVAVLAVVVTSCQVTGLID